MSNEQLTQISESKPLRRLDVWFMSLRPKSLVASSIPVLVALSLAWSDLASVSGKFRWIPAICCLGFAMLAQASANLINDYADFVKGADGPDRVRSLSAVASGLISPRAILIATLCTLTLACCFGLGTIPYGGWVAVAVGIVTCVFCLLYSAGPFPFAYNGLGDVLVVAFFGFVAVGFTYYLQTDALTLDTALLGLGVGFAVDSILIANNYCDREEDRAHRKFTLIAIFGERFGRYFYLANGLLVVVTLALVFWRRNTPLSVMSLVTLGVYLALHLQAWVTLARIRSGPALAKLLILSGRNVVVLGILLVFALTA